MSPPAKRQRTEDAPITRSDIWYTDGSVVFQAQNTQFRVHWGVLTQHSSFFRDMQGLPQPADQPSIDGCPVVELHDSADDVKYLFTALYTPFVTFLGQKGLPLPAVAALIRLGRKYDFRELLDSAVERFTYENPATLKEYDALNVAHCYTTTRIVHYPGIVFDMLTLAKENNILSALPCAYYRVVDLHTQLFDGISRGDGTFACLDPADHRQCVLGHSNLLRKQFDLGCTFSWVPKWPYADCSTADKCRKSRDSFWRQFTNNIFMSAMGTPSHNLGKHFCSPCSEDIKELICAGREKVWKELPSLFDLPPWNELKNDP
ncbi:hypothetical protein C8R43DRAFT_906353 [Mycena crocata]|nr:hypothetical protein C8R43DRAFT_906353 [Mycena crocata]